MTSVAIIPDGDAGFLIELGGGIAPDTNRRALLLAGRLRQLLRGVPELEVVPAYSSVLVSGRPGLVTVEMLRPALISASERPLDSSPSSERVLVIPVAYGGDFGPDLDGVAELRGLTAEQVIDLHGGPTYRIYCLGFSPGFPYLGGLDPALSTPRLSSPRPRVPAGSVGIGGEQTGVYPTATPGGWRIIGRTPLALFDAHREPPVDYRPGDSLRFLPISRTDFHRLAPLGLSPDKYARRGEER